MLSRAGHYVVYLLVRVVISIVQALSLETAMTLARVLGWLLADVLRIRRRLVDENLAAAFPQKSQAERDQIAREQYEHLLLLIFEVAHAPRKIHETNWRKFVTIHRKRELVASMLSPRPRVIVTAHFGNFEIAGFMSGLLGIPTFTVARTLDNPYLDNFLNQFRELKGQFILPKVGSAPQADAVLELGGSLVLLGDHHAGRKGCWVEFFNRPASCHKAVALFTLLSGAPMVVTSCRRTGKMMQFELGLLGIQDPLVASPELAGVKPLTQWYNGQLEEIITKYPSQYWWVHHRWRDPPPAKKSKSIANNETSAAETPAEQTSAAQTTTSDAPASGGDTLPGSSQRSAA